MQNTSDNRSTASVDAPLQIGGGVRSGAGGGGWYRTVPKILEICSSIL